MSDKQVAEAKAKFEQAQVRLFETLFELEKKGLSHFANEIARLITARDKAKEALRVAKSRLVQ